MTSRHLPAGQNIQPAPGVVVPGMGMPIAMPPAVDGPPPIAGPMPPLHGAHQTPTRMVPRPPAHHHAGVPPHHSQYAPQYHHNMVNAPMYHQGYAAPQAYYPNYYGMMSQYSNGVPPPYVNGGPVQYPNGFNGAQYPNGLNGAQYPNGLNSAQYQGVPNGAQYHNGGMPTPGHNMPYQAYSRSPNTMHQQYSPMMGITVEQNGYPHQQMQSPAVARSYQPPTVPGAMASQPTSSIQSPQMIPPPTPPTPHFKEFIPGSHVKEFIPTAKSREFVPTGSLPKTFKPVSKEIIPPVSVEVSPAQAPVPVVALPPTIAAQPEPFRPPVPWLSQPNEEFPKRARNLRAPRKQLADGQILSLPFEQQPDQSEMETQAAAETTPSTQPHEVAARPQTPQPQDLSDKTPSTPSTQETSENPASTSTSPSTPRSDTVQRSRTNTTTSDTPTKPTKPAVTKPALPLVPVTKHASKPSTSEKPQPVAKKEKKVNTEQKTETTVTAEAPKSENGEVQPVAALAKPAPSSWANLFAKKAAANGSNGVVTATGVDENGVTVQPASNTNVNNVAEAIRDFKVSAGDKTSYIEPRGLINTGNMCYMNSVLQVLMFCIPFYGFLNQVSSRAVHSFKSETPLVDAMIMFMHEFTVLKSVDSIDKLRQTLKADDIEKYGEPFTPEFVYEAIRKLPRFSSMIHGHQQDAEEFLGFLLQSLDDECTSVMKTALSAHAAAANGSAENTESGDWLEVGRKQKAAVTRSSGSNISTPINKIFGGLLRSEFRVPGLKDSITLEPYQPLQLDIGSADVHSVADALRGLTRPERLQGDFNSPRGKDVVATKQVSIETLPPVLILHLKRFKFDAEGHGTVKIWKKIDYPLELEIPREALSRQIRESAVPKYKLISVVYHHGKTASGGHYTVDVRRQDGQDWLRLDDTVLRRVRSDDIAEAGAQEESRKLRNQNEIAPVGASGNPFNAIDDDADEGDWKQVTTSANGNKRWSSVVNENGIGSATKSKQHKENLRDNKVAYLLFYQRV